MSIDKPQQPYLERTFSIWIGWILETKPLHIVWRGTLPYLEWFFSPEGGTDGFLFSDHRRAISSALIQWREVLCERRGIVQKADTKAGKNFSRNLGVLW